MLAISELHARTSSWRLARNGLALRTGLVPSVRRYLEGRARIVLDHRATYSRLKSASRCPVATGVYRVLRNDDKIVLP